MTLLESIVKDLHELPANQLVEVSNFVHQLNPGEKRARRLKAIRSTAGCMPGEEGEDFERSVRELADRIDPDEQ